MEAPSLRKLGVTRLAIFGSAARGDLRPDSDLDFLLELRHKTFDQYMQVKELLEKSFDRRVDLVLTSAIKPMLRETILREAVDAPLD
jgi:predicted nucleotidyltransferase